MHTAMTLPCLLNADGSRAPVKSVLALIPANTVGNWEDEVTKWTGHLDKPLRTCSLRKFSKDFRQGEIEKWQKEGGVLFMTAGLFLLHGDFIVEQPAHQPQVLIIDEAHTLLKNSHNKIAKMLDKIQTKRRILLTGTPLQNNATEFFQNKLINFVRPGVIPGAPTENSLISRHLQVCLDSFSKYCYCPVP
jgi:SNF2 family DNA or RNA helicase